MSRWLLVPLFLLFFWLAVSSMVGDSPTMDEQKHIARGIAYLKTGDPRLSVEHPPLINSIAALPLLTLSDLRLPTDDPSWNRDPILYFWYFFADKLMWTYNRDLVYIITFLTRLPIIFLAMLMGALGYRFGRKLWHPRAGLLASFLILFDPNIIAHARYDTTDLGGMATMLFALYALWRMWEYPKWSWTRLLVAAVAIGCTFGSKLSMIGFAPIFVLLSLLPIYTSPNNAKTIARRFLQCAVAGLLSIIVLWAIYGFDWGPYTFVGEPLIRYNSQSGIFPTLFAGVERISVATTAGRDAFLLGQTSPNGFSAYFPIAFLLKTPVTILWLVAIGVPFLLVNRGTRSRALILFIPAAIYFFIISRTGLNIGYRHLLPMLPPLYIMLSGAMPLRFRQQGTTTFQGFVIYLSYFNEIDGGPRNGHNSLIDSNIDWGQDLWRLRDWMNEKGYPSVKLSYFGSADPTLYLPGYEPLPGFSRYEQFKLWWEVPFNRVQPEPGVYVISVHNLKEMPLSAEERTVFQYFRDRKPDDYIGYSLNVYIVKP